MFQTLYYLALSFTSLAILVKAADYLIDSAKIIAKKFGVSDRVIALTLVSFGTSLPEFIVGVFSALKGNSGIVLGDVLGSNIANLSLGVGLSSLFYTIPLVINTMWKEIPLYTAIALIFIFLSMDKVINVWDALTMLIIFAFFVQYIIEEIIDGKGKIETKLEEKISNRKFAKAIIILILSIVGLYFGGEILVNSIVKLSELLRIGSYVLASIIVAIGTSLPEIIVSLSAALKKEEEILIGDIMGSNIFNLGFILPIAAIINPIKVGNFSILTAFLTILASTVMFTLAFVIEKGKLTKKEGIVLLGIYAFFLVNLIKYGKG